MSCKSGIYMTNTSTPSVATNSLVPLGNVQRRYGCSLSGSAYGVQLKECGYYLINISVTYTAPSTGVVSLALQQDGNNVTGATAAETVVTETTEQHTISITAIVRVFSSSTPSLLSIMSTGIQFDPSNVAMTVVKI